MSTSYYLVDKKKKKEYEDFEKYLDETLIPEFKSKLYEYAKEINGELVNKDNMESFIDNHLRNLKYFPLTDEAYSYRIGYLAASGFHFDNWHNIRCLKELQNYLAENPDCIVEDDEGNDVTDHLEELIGYSPMDDFVEEKHIPANELWNAELQKFQPGDRVHVRETEPYSGLRWLEGYNCTVKSVTKKYVRIIPDGYPDKPCSVSPFILTKIE